MTRGLQGKVTTEIGEHQESLSQSPSVIGSNHVAYRNHVHEVATSLGGSLQSEKTAYFLEKIHEAAHDPDSVAEANYDLVGGGIYSTAQYLLEKIPSSVSGFMNAFDHARTQGMGYGESLAEASRKAPEEADKIMSQWVESKVAVTSDNLTPEQQNYYREHLLKTIPGMEGTTQEESAQITSLYPKQPKAAKEIASLLRRASSQNRPDLIELIGNLNRSAKTSRVR